MRFKNYILSFLVVLTSSELMAQIQMKTFYDDEKQTLKEVYVVKEGNESVLHGAYTSFYENGNEKSHGQYLENVSTGIWEFFYSNGRLRMRGEIRNGKSEGFWEYFYENGEKSMEGEIKERSRQGAWRLYYDNGSLKSEGNFVDSQPDGPWKYYFEKGGLMAMADYEVGVGDYTEYFPSGSIKMEGIKNKGFKEGHWIYYYEDGTEKGKGRFQQDQRHGVWEFFNEQGNISSKGDYMNGQPHGEWTEYYENGVVSSQGDYSEGQKNGFWNLFYDDGTRKGEGNFQKGSGEYLEYYKNGQIKVEGLLENGKNHGAWNYYYENGKIEGVADFDNGIGSYSGYYTTGELKMKGSLRNNERIGIWELYKETGELAGYYKPYYEDGNPTLWLAKDNEQQKALAQVRSRKLGSYLYKKKKFNYFNPQLNEYKAVIIGYNPLALLLNSFPMGLEYYTQERLGHEILANLIRDPFFRSHKSLDIDDEYKEGFQVAIRQKFYTKEKKTGVPYFGHELRYSYINHLVRSFDSNQGQETTLKQNESKYEYSLFVGNRFFKDQTAGGMTLDGYIGAGIGYRGLKKDYTETDDNSRYFDDVPTSNIALAFRFGLNLGFAIGSQ